MGKHVGVRAGREFQSHVVGALGRPSPPPKCLSFPLLLILAASFSLFLSPSVPPSLVHFPTLWSPHQLPFPASLTLFSRLSLATELMDTHQNLLVRMWLLTVGSEGHWKSLKHLLRL